MSEDAQKPILIKKYANRRLYHTVRSEYVVLDDLSAMVRDGEEFVVQDAKSGEDITRSIMTQIIFDAENSGSMMLPTSFLRDVIRLYGDSVQSMVPNYLENAMQNFVAHQDELRENFAQNPAFAGIEHLSKLNKDWMEQSMKMFGAMNPAMGAIIPKETPKAESELDELKSQLKDMQDKLSKIVDK